MEEVSATRQKASLHAAQLQQRECTRRQDVPKHAAAVCTPVLTLLSAPMTTPPSYCTATMVVPVCGASGAAWPCIAVRTTESERPPRPTRFFRLTE